MSVNICPRLIEKMIKSGNNFVNYNNQIFYNNLPLGVYAKQTYKSGEIVRIMSGKLLNMPTRQSIHIGNNMHLEDKIGQYINHSFDPNVKVEGNKLIAINDINIYDELTFNYNDTEIEMAYPFEDDGNLVCGKKN